MNTNYDTSTLKIHETLNDKRSVTIDVDVVDIKWESV